MIHYFEAHAQREFDDAIEYYDGISPQLGTDFGEAMNTFEEILALPLSFRQKSAPGLRVDDSLRGWLGI